MKTIWKYVLPIQDEFHLQMPKDAAILAVDAQADVPCLWALVDDQAPRMDRNFRLRGTGHNADLCDVEKYIGTFQMAGGALIFHLFDGD